MEHETPPKVCLKAATAVVSFWQKRPLREPTCAGGGAVATRSCHGVNDQNTQTCPCKWVCISLTALLEGSRISQTPFWKGLSRQWLILLNLKSCFRGVVGWAAMPALQALLCHEDKTPGQCVWGSWLDLGLSLATTYIATLFRDQIWIWARANIFWLHIICEIQRSAGKMCPLAHPVVSSFKMYAHFTPSHLLHQWPSGPSHLHLLPGPLREQTF